MLFLEGNRNEFTGKVFDIDGVGCQSDVASIKGFYDNGSISFIKQYPQPYVLEDDGTLSLDKSRKTAEIHYYGEYNESLEQFSGSWEMVESEKKHEGGYIEYLNTGTWEMRKEKE